VQAKNPFSSSKSLFYLHYFLNFKHCHSELMFTFFIKFFFFRNKDCHCQPLFYLNQQTLFLVPKSLYLTQIIVFFYRFLLRFLLNSLLQLYPYFHLKSKIDFIYFYFNYCSKVKNQNNLSSDYHLN
jgi:hypothetical protein